MKIEKDDFNVDKLQLLRSQPTGTAHDSAAAAVQGVSPTRDDTVTLSVFSHLEKTVPFNAEKVRQHQDEIRQGRYSVNPKAIATALLAENLKEKQAESVKTEPNQTGLDQTTFFDSQKVREIAEAINKGQFTISPESIADALMAVADPQLLKQAQVLASQLQLVKPL